MPLSEGARFAGYTVVRLLGAGGMGEVYLVRHPRLPRFEALKILRADLSADPDYQQRFNREADLAGALWHPHIVGVHDRGEFEGQLWITMDYVNGPDVGALLRQHYPTGMPPAQVIDIMTAVGAALDHAHHRGLLHRDVKPANIMVSHPDDGGTPRIMLSDFGIARPVDDTTGLTVTNMTVGTVDYCSPEQLLGHQLDPRADQYSLAATAYHLLTGTKPFANPSPVAVISAHLTQRPPLPGTIRPHLAGTDPVFARALAKTPTDRYPRCTDFATALANQLLTAAQHTRSPAPAAPPRPPEPPAAAPPRVRPPRRRRVLAAASLAVAAVAVTVAALLVIPRIGGGSSHSAQPGGPQQDAARQAGQRYLEALARGDAAGALAVSANPPATTQFLTADVLRAQLAAAPITAVTVTPAPAAPGDDPADVQYVMLSAKFGPTLSQARVGVHRNGDEWKLDGGTVAVDIGSPGSNNASLKAVALWGVATNGASPVAVFPGALAVSSSNPNIDITAQAQPVLLDGLTGAADRPTIQPVATLNDVGRQAVKTALDSWTRHCFRGVAPPPDCSTLDTGNTTVVVDGGGDFSKVTFAFDPNTMAVTTSGPIVYHGRAAGIADYTVSSVPIGTVDLTKEPPVFVRTARG